MYQAGILSSNSEAPDMHGAASHSGSRAGFKDSLGCATAALARDEVICLPHMVFRRKSAHGRHKSHVDTAAQDRGLLVGLSLTDGHQRAGGLPGRTKTHLFDCGDIYIRDFDSAYSADMDGTFDFFLIELSPDFLRNTETLVERPAKDLDRVQAQEDQVLRHLASAMLPALAKPDAADALFVEQLSIAIGAHLLHRHRAMGDVSDANHRLSVCAIRQAQELLLTVGEDSATIASIAETLSMSRNAFYRAFRTSLGVTPYQWLLAQRIEQARRLLSGTNLSLAEIALTCGFSDQSHFTRVFGKVEGISPGHWRQRAR
ncbi:helix-turn-helix domain-containing protein [Paracoccus aestuariivivens]|uniref:Helix-turn-helix domain-containing protein n=1 Tax=Paracoccus aestuariivivens TaxID=1820333 RepID=A0A6L6JD98_9RHOB|nr:helix-turn-helix domain-containing protein [Paracoccus aestuariivivens]